jgi:hypothetical protein
LRIFEVQLGRIVDAVREAPLQVHFRGVVNVRCPARGEGPRPMVLSLFKNLLSNRKRPFVFIKIESFWLFLLFKARLWKGNALDKLNISP